MSHRWGKQWLGKFWLQRPAKLFATRMEVVWEHIFLQSLCHPLSIRAQCIVSRPKQSFQQPQKCLRWVILLWTHDVPWLRKLETISMESRAWIQITSNHCCKWSLDSRSPPIAFECFWRQFDLQPIPLKHRLGLRVLEPMALVTAPFASFWLNATAAAACDRVWFLQFLVYVKLALKLQ